MEISINAKGPRDHVKQEVSTQITALRRVHTSSQALLASIGDELSRRITKAPGTEMVISVDLIIDLTIPKGAEAPAAEDAIEVNGVRLTRAEFDRRIAAQANAPAPFIGTSASGSDSLISNDE